MVFLGHRQGLSVGRAAQVVVGDVVLKRAQEQVGHRVRDRNHVQHPLGARHRRQGGPALEGAEGRCRDRGGVFVDLRAVRPVPGVVGVRSSAENVPVDVPVCRQQPPLKGPRIGVRGQAIGGFALGGAADAVGVCRVAAWVEPRAPLGLVLPEAVEEAANGDHIAILAGPPSAVATSRPDRRPECPRPGPRRTRRRGSGSGRRNREVGQALARTRRRGGRPGQSPRFASARGGHVGGQAGRPANPGRHRVAFVPAGPGPRDRETATAAMNQPGHPASESPS